MSAPCGCQECAVEQLTADLAMAQAEVLRLRYDLERADKALDQARAELDDKDNSLNIHFEDRMRVAAAAHDAALADLRERAAKVADTFGEEHRVAKTVANLIRALELE